MKSWDEVAKSNEYLALPPEKKARAKELYFQEVVAPQLPPEKHARAKELFSEYAATLDPQEGSLAGDMWAGFAQGANALLGIAGELYGEATGNRDNWATRQAESGRQYWEDTKSEAQKRAEAQRALAIRSADGEVDKGLTALKETVTNPRLLSGFVAEQIPMFTPIGMVGRGAKGASIGLGMAEKWAGRTGTGAAVGAGAAMQGADVGQQTYQQLMGLPEAVWQEDLRYKALASGEMGPDKAKEVIANKIANEAAAKGGIASLALNALPGGHVLERALAGGGKSMAGGMMTRGLTGLVGEGATEAGEEGYGAYAANQGTQQIDPNQDLMAGVGEQAGMGVAAGLFGFAGGVLSGGKKQDDQGDNTGDQTDEDIKEIEREAERARKLLEHKKRKPDATDPPQPKYAGALPGVTAPQQNANPLADLPPAPSGGVEPFDDSVEKLAKALEQYADPGEVESILERAAIEGKSNDELAQELVSILHVLGDQADAERAQKELDAMAAQTLKPSTAQIQVPEAKPDAGQDPRQPAASKEPGRPKLASLGLPNINPNAGLNTDQPVAGPAVRSVKEIFRQAKEKERRKPPKQAPEQATPREPATQAGFSLPERQEFKPTHMTSGGVPVVPDQATAEVGIPEVEKRGLFRSGLNRKGVADHGGATYKILQSPAQEDAFYVQREQDGVRETDGEEAGLSLAQAVDLADKWAFEESTPAEPQRQDKTLAGKTITVPVVDNLERTYEEADAKAREDKGRRGIAGNREREKAREDREREGQVGEVLLTKAGKPFKTEKSAKISKAFRENSGAKVVPVDGGYGVQLPPKEETSSAQQEVDRQRAEQTKDKVESAKHSVNGSESDRQDEVRLSRSAMKSVEANVRRGRDALAKAVAYKTSVHRAMFRNGLGWVDFVWGDEGKAPGKSGKRKGAKGLAHILEARMRKDGYSEREAIRFLEDMVETIARGREIDRYEFKNHTQVRIENNNNYVIAVKRKGSNAWVVTAFKEKPGGIEAAYESSMPTHPAATPSRNRMGAGYSKVAQDQESVNSPLSDVDLDAVVERIASVVKFHDADGVQVVSDFDALPAAAKKNAQRQGAGKGDVEGVFHKGTIYLIADMIRDEAHAETVLFHEAAHRGLRALYSDAKVKVAMNRLYLAMGGAKGFNRLAREFGVNLDDYRVGVTGRLKDGGPRFSRETRNAILVEELVAHIAERGSKGLKQKALELIGAIRDWLRRHGFLALAEYKAADIASLAREARMRGMAGNRKSVHGTRLMMAGRVEPVRVPARTIRWMGFDRASFSADYEALQRRHPEHYSSASKVRQDVEYVMAKPDDWYPHADGRVTIFRQGEKGIPSVRIDLRAERDGGYRIVSVYPLLKRSVAKKMRKKKEALSQVGRTPERIVGSKTPGQLSIAEYLEALGNESRLPASSSEDALKASDNNINNDSEESKALLRRTGKIVPGNGRSLPISSEFIDNFKSLAKEQSWGLLTLRQITEIAGRQVPKLKQRYLPIFTQYETDMNSLKAKAGDIAQERQKLKKPVNEALSKLQHEATIAGVDPAEKFKPLIDDVQEAYQRIAVLERRIKNSSGHGNSKWLREIQRIKADLAADKRRKREYDGLRAQWDALPKKAKEVYIREREHHKEMSRMMQDALIQRIADMDASSGFKAAMMDKLRMEFDKTSRMAPYFPLARFGRYWVSSKDANGETYFDMFESRAAQDRFIKESQGKLEITGAGKQLEGLADVQGVDPTFVTEVDALLQGMGDGPEVNELRDEVYQLYLQKLPELSARKHYIHRKKTKGFSRDQARAFAAKALHDANHIARLRHLHRLERVLSEAQEALDVASSISLRKSIEKQNDALEAILNSADGMSLTDLKDAVKDMNADHYKRPVPYSFNDKDSILDEIERRLAINERMLEDARHIEDVEFVSNALNELQKSHLALANPNTHPVAQKLNSLGFAWFLGLTPAAALVNLAQTPTVALPLIGAKYGMARVSKHLTRAAKDFMAGGMSVRKKLNQEEADAFQYWLDSGLLSDTLAHDLAGVADAGINNGTFRFKAITALSFMFHHAERMNREITALAAYRAAREQGIPHAKAMEQAADLTYKSHFDYSAGNRARFMRGNFARVVTQFKQYSQNVTYLYAKTLHDVFKGSTPEEKAEARRALTGMLIGQIAVAGSLGLPLAGVMMAAAQGLADAFGDDDPIDVKAEYRQWLKEIVGKTWGQVLAKGFVDTFTPFSVSGRLSLSDLWIRTSDRDLEGRAKAQEYINALLGPQTAIATHFFVGMDLMAEGKIQRGMEYVVPKFLKDAARSVRFLEEGARSMRGYELKEIEPVEAIGQFLGFSPSELSELYEVNTAIRNVENKRNARRRALIDAVVIAREEKDVKGINAAWNAIHEWNRKHPDDKITRKTIKKSVAGRKRYAKSLRHGVRATRRNRDLLDRFDYAVGE